MYERRAGQRSGGLTSFVTHIFHITLTQIPARPQPQCTLATVATLCSYSQYKVSRVIHKAHWNIEIS